MITTIIDLFLHLDQHLADLTQQYGTAVHFILFAIIFAETGLVVTPFLPGDSLLFAAGALSAISDSQLSLLNLMWMLSLAGILGDSVNYSIGRRLGPRVFQFEKSRLLNKEHLIRAQRFYEKYGSAAVVLARFVPIVRTFAPFVAGVGEMNYRRFLFFNVLGGLIWVNLFLLGGYWFGNLPAVKSQFHFVIVGIIVVSVLPIAWEAVRHHLRSRS